jgi:hypothetical protein
MYSQEKNMLMMNKFRSFIVCAALMIGMLFPVLSAQADESAYPPADPVPSMQTAAPATETTDGGDGETTLSCGVCLDGGGNQVSCNKATNKYPCSTSTYSCNASSACY